MSPQAIAHYRVTAKFGIGGMGELYRATDTRVGVVQYSSSGIMVIPGEKSLSSSGNAPLAWRRAVRRSGS